MQGEVEAAWSRATGLSENFALAGRTDAGVHAEGQVASVATTAVEIAEELRLALERELPEDIRLQSVHEVGSDFHARHCARWRKYEYRLPAKAASYLDIEGMRSASSRLTRERDFASLASTGRTGPRGTIRRIYSVDVEREAPTGDVILRVIGDAFLRQMVRRLVSGLVLVGSGKMTEAELERGLQLRSRTLMPGPAPAGGLTLVEVGYGDYTK